MISFQHYSGFYKEIHFLTYLNFFSPTLNIFKCDWIYQTRRLWTVHKKFSLINILFLKRKGDLFLKNVNIPIPRDSRLWKTPYSFHTFPLLISQPFDFSRSWWRRHVKTTTVDTRYITYIIVITYRQWWRIIYQPRQKVTSQILSVQLSNI